MFEDLKTYMIEYLPDILLETVHMVFLTAIIAFIGGLILGTILYLTRKSKTKWVNIIYKVLDVLVGILRSFPFYILIFVLIPFTRIIMEVLTGRGTFTSTGAFIVPLSVAAIPFFGKLIESSLIEVNNDVVEAATSLGLSTWQIIRRVVIREALPSIVSGITLGIVTLVGYSAMAGAVGAGGLGDFAMTQGMIVYNTNMMIFAVVTIVILVLLIQGIGNLIYKLVK